MRPFTQFHPSHKTQIIFFLICLFSIPCLLGAQDLAENDPGADHGLVYFLRGKGVADTPFVLFDKLDPVFYSYNITYNTFIDDVLVCKLNQKRYSSHLVSPGEHTFKVQTVGKKGKKKTKSETIEINPGQTYYILIIHTGYYPALQEVTRNTALAVYEENRLKPDLSCDDTDYVF